MGGRNPDGYVVTVSGGWDSAAALLMALEGDSFNRYPQGPVLGMFVNYGQPYLAQEWERASQFVRNPVIAEHTNWGGLIQVDAEMTVDEATPWVPYRNLVIASLGIHHVMARNARALVVGSKSARYRPNDPSSYLDSTLKFYMALERLVAATTEEPHLPSPLIWMPVVGLSKLQVRDYLLDKGIDPRTLWSCYRVDGENKPCGTCAHCLESLPLIESLTAPTQRTDLT